MTARFTDREGLHLAANTCVIENMAFREPLPYGFGCQGGKNDVGLSFGHEGRAGLSPWGMFSASTLSVGPIVWFVGLSVRKIKKTVTREDGN